MKISRRRSCRDLFTSVTFAELLYKPNLRRQAVLEQFLGTNGQRILTLSVLLVVSLWGKVQPPVYAGAIKPLAGTSSC